MIKPPSIRQSAVDLLKAPQKRVSLDPHAASVKMFQNPEAYGTSLFVAATSFLTIEELGSFAPQTIRLELQDATKIRRIDQDLMDRLMAAIAIVTTDRFYADLPSFIEICNVLGGTPPAPDLFDPADAYEIAWALAEAKILDGLDDSEHDAFSEEIRVYMGAALEMEGFFSAPGVIPMAIMTNQYNPAESFADSSDLLPAVLESDLSRHEDINAILIENMANLVEQLETIRPGIIEALGTN